jgi:LuxR family maltose regulon positive regulatory protein
MPNQNLFKAKVFPPESRASTLRRTRLTEPLVSLPSSCVAFIHAPAGYGKTTLVTDAAKQSGAILWWLSLDELDRDPGRLLQYLALAAGTEVPSSGHSGPGIYETLANICGSSTDDKDTWIVLDDIHFLDESADCSSLVDYLARHLPPGFRLILASRTPSDLASLPRLRVQGRLIELGPDDLAFTDEEIVGLARGMSRRLTAEEARSIRSTTGGWPVAVSLSITNAHPVATLRTFISAEIVERLPDHLGDFLTKTSVLEILDAEACDFLLSRSDAKTMLSQLELRSVPIVRLGSGPAYKLHAVVRNELLETLREDDRDLHRDLQRSAAEWFIKNGQREAAISHLVGAQDWDQAATEIENLAPSAYRAGRWHAVTAWLQMLPDEVRSASPSLSAWEARLLIRFGRADEALQVIDACRHASSAMASEVEAELEVMSAAALRIKGDFESAVVFARRSLDIAIQQDAALSTVAEAHKQLGMALFGRGSYEDAARELTAARDIADRRGDREESAVCNACLGSAMDSLGRFAEASVFLDRACELWRQQGNTKELSWTLNNLAMTYFQSGQLETARELFLEAIAKAQESDYRRTEMYAMTSLADLDRFAGDLSSSFREYKDGLQLAGEVSEPSIQAHLQVGLSDVQRRQGDIVGAEASATKALVSARTRKSKFEEGIAHLALARIHRHKGGFKEALGESATAVDHLSTVGPSRELMESLLLRGDLLLESRRHRSELLETLSKLAEIISTTGLAGLLSQIGHSHFALLEYGASRRVAGRFYHEIVKSLKAARQPVASDGGAFPTVEVQSFGTFSVTVDGRTILDSEWESDKSKELLLLLLESSNPLTRDEIIASLWPDAGGGKANSVFHSSLYRLRRALYHESVVQSSGTYYLNPEGVSRWDVARFRQLLGATGSVKEEHDEAPIENLHAAVQLYTGPLAHRFDSPWVNELRAQLETLFIDALSNLADQLLARGDAKSAFEAAGRLLEIDPFSESACRRVMQAAIESGRAEVARRTYERFSVTLQEELDDEPSAALAELARSATAKATNSP